MILLPLSHPDSPFRDGEAKLISAVSEDIRTIVRAASQNREGDETTAADILKATGENLGELQVNSFRFWGPKVEMANDENKRAAAGILTNLSGFVITACLTMLAIEGGLIAFVLGNRIVGYAYYSLSVLAFVAFVISVVLGGLGITRTAEEKTGNQ